ncbi:MAG: hypothetical protein RLZ47_807 [Bacteroidota bacterium]|jgi:ankyrin repeat protein
MIKLLEELIESGNAQALNQLLATEPNLLQLKTSRNLSPLLHACETRNQEIIAILVEHQTEFDLFEACACGKFDWVTHQISKNPEQLSQCAYDGLTALGLAVQFGQEEIVRYLLIKDVEVNTAMNNNSLNFPLHLAILNHQDMIAKMLLEAGALVNVTQAEGLSPLHLAASRGNIELIIQLLEAGAEVKQQCLEGKTAGDLAEENGWSEIARILND